MQKHIDRIITQKGGDKMQRHTVGVVLFAILALAVVACGDDTTESSGATGTETTAAPSVEESVDPEAPVEPAEPAEPEESVEPAEPEAPAEPVKQEDPLRAALLMTARPTDSTWDERGYAGLLALESEFGAETAFTEYMSGPEMEGAFRDYASQGYDIVIGHSFGFGDAALAAAADFPETTFLISAGAHQADNVASVSLDEQEAFYLAGVLAAEVSQTATIGYIGGQDFPSLILEVNGYIDGATSVNPDIEVLIGWVGSFGDPVRAQELTIAMIDDGVDVVVAVTGGGDPGIWKAADDHDIWVIQGISSCMEDLPDNCLSSADIIWESIIPTWIDLWLSGEAEGIIYQWGISDGAVDIGTINPAADPSVVETVEAVREQIIDGSLVIPAKFTLEE